MILCLVDTFKKRQKADDKVYVCKSFKTKPVYYREFKDLMANTVDLDEAAHYEIANSTISFFSTSCITYFTVRIMHISIWL